MGGGVGTAWRLALLGFATVAAGLGGVLVASIQGMALVPGGTLLDGYDVGLLPWMDVGTWLIPIGGLLSSIAAAATIWLSRSGGIARSATIPALAAVAFWAFLAWLGMAPRNAVDGSVSSSGLQTVVYSRPLDTVLFLLVPTIVLMAVAALARRSAGAGSTFVR